MRIVRYCGRERLPGGARLWRRLARRARFDGVLLVFGYGVGGRPGDEQRKAERTGELSGMVLADYEPGAIRVWVPCTCQAAEFDADQLREDADDLAHRGRRGRGEGRLLGAWQHLGRWSRRRGSRWSAATRAKQ